MKIPVHSHNGRTDMREYVGLSTDRKPTTNDTIPPSNGDTFYEKDTRNEFVYLNARWLKREYSAIRHMRRWIGIGDSLRGRGNYSTTLTGITHVNGIATTASASGHAQYPGSAVLIGNCDQAGFNGLKTVLERISSTSFTFACDPTLPASATGTNIVAVNQELINDRDHFEIANASLGAPFYHFLNAGVSGEDTTEIAARFDAQILPYILPGDIVAICGFINDVIGAGADGNLPAVIATAKTNYLAMITKIRAAGSVPLLETCVPYNTDASSWTLARSIAVCTFNAWLKEICNDTYQDCLLLDVYRIVTDKITGDFLTSPFDYAAADNLHPTAFAEQRIAAELELLLTPFVHPRSPYSVNALDTWDTDPTSKQICPNPLMQGTGGTATTAGSGSGSITLTENVPDDWTLTWTRNGAGGSCTVTTPARADGVGNDLSVVVVATAANDAVDIVQTDQLHERVSPGDRIYAECFLKVSAMTAVSIVQFGFEWEHESVTYTVPRSVSSSGSGALDDDYDTVQLTRDLIVPPEGITGLKTRLKVACSGAGGFTVLFSRAVMVKRQASRVTA